MNPKRIQKKVSKLRKKGKLPQAIELQRQLCQDDDQNVEAWSLLADLAAEAKMADVELATRFCIAKLTKVDPDHWVELSERATAAGFESDAVDALFNAADTAALIGDTRRAVELCDMVLGLDPKHRPTQRIRGIMSARLLRMGTQAEEEAAVIEPEGQEEVSVSQRDWSDPTESTLNFLKMNRRPPRPTNNADINSFKEMVAGDWMPPDPAIDASGRVTPAGFVCAPQRWPSVLDQQSLMFVGSITEIDAEVVALAEPVEVAQGTFIYTQGRDGHLLYCLDRGQVRASRERGFVQDLGTIGAGSFFGEVVTIAGFPSTTSVETTTNASLRVLTRDKFHKAIREKTPGVEKVISSLRSWYLETVISICPAFAFCDNKQLARLTDRWTSFKPGQALAQQDTPGDLHVIITGVAQVTLDHHGETLSLGRLSTGDLVGEMNPSPITVTAECTVLAIVIDRDLMEQLPEEAKTELEASFARCRAALAEVYSQD